ncbi:MAG: GtrA family protein [Eubacteriales bacterium]|jgi:putative flippase GtrA
MIHKLIIRYKEFILFGIVGGGTTIINMGSYFLFSRLLHVHYFTSNILAWIAGFAFAFLANKLWVFQSKSFAKQIFTKELVSFFSARAATGILDMGILYLFVSIMGIPDLISKTMDVVIIAITNYFLSKYWIFKRRKSTAGSNDKFISESDKTTDIGIYTTKDG